MSVQENIVEMPLAGSPRWWTFTNSKGKREVGRAIFERGVHYDMARENPELPEEMLLFVLLPHGCYTWPPLVVAALRLGPIGWHDIEAKGGKPNSAPAITLTIAWASLVMSLKKLEL